MAYPARLITLLTVCSLFVMMPAEANQPISCTAGSFFLKRDASVTCQFNENLRTSKKNFNIVQYPFNRKGSNSDSGTYVLVCNWKQSSSDYECKTEDGFTFNKAVSDTVVLGIPAVSTSSGGVYVCQVVPDNGVPLETCTLSVKEASPLEQCPKCECSCAQAEMVGICATILVILLVALLFFGFRYARKRYSLEKRVGNPQQDKCICCGFAYKVQRKPKHTHTENVNSARSDTVVFTNEGESEKLLGHGNLPGPEVFIIQPRTQGVQSTSRPDAIVKVGVPEEGKKDDTDNQPAFEEQPHATTESDTRDDYIGLCEDVDRPSKPIKEESGPIRALGYETWTTDQVCQWLTQEKASPTLIKLMNEKEVTGSMFDNQLKTNGKMKDFGITDKKECNQLEGKIKTLKQQATKEAKEAKAEEKKEKVAADKAKKEAEKENKKKKK